MQGATHSRRDSEQSSPIGLRFCLSLSPRQACRFPSSSTADFQENDIVRIWVDDAGLMSKAEFKENDRHGIRRAGGKYKSVE